jgi:hypothetical protein
MDTGLVSARLAADLRDAGLRWTPAPGDRFVIPKPGLEGSVFTLSEMTIEAHEYPTGTVLGFNGTTEWALDSVAKEEALWLPREDQVRDLLGGTFRSLRRVDDEYVVTTRDAGGAEHEYRARAAAEAYGLALLALVRRAMAEVHAS